MKGAKSQYELVQGVLYKLCDLPGQGTETMLVKQLVVPPSLRGALLHMVHEDPLSGGHLATTKAFAKLRTRYWWPRMYTDTD